MEIVSSTRFVQRKPFQWEDNLFKKKKIKSIKSKLKQSNGANDKTQSRLLTITIGLPKSSTQFCRVRQNQRSEWKRCAGFFCCGKCPFALTELLLTQIITDFDCTEATLEKKKSALRCHLFAHSFKYISCN